jgi:malate dehydrogenase (oxaloacetate-decarboxylating)
MDINQASLDLHEKLHGKIGIEEKTEIKTKHDLSLLYTPGVAAVSSAIAEDASLAYKYTLKKNTVAVISDGSAVLGLGNIGPLAALPVMEGKCLIFKHFAGIDAFPIVLSTQDPDEIIKTVLAIAPTFGGINLEDIASPKCFYIERELRKLLPIPVIHDDQWGAAVAVLAGLFNALKLIKKDIDNMKIVVLGAGAAGTAVTKLLIEAGAKHLLVCDQTGIIYRKRSGLVGHKIELAELTNPDNTEGALTDAIKGADIFIGMSKAHAFPKELLSTMNSKPVIFSLANPVPEISQEDALENGAFIYASGRSNQPNQINNALIYPGIFRGMLDNAVRTIHNKTLIQIARVISECVEDLSPDHIMPSIFQKNIVQKVSEVISSI